MVGVRRRVVVGLIMLVLAIVGTVFAAICDFLVILNGTSSAAIHTDQLAPQSSSGGRFLLEKVPLRPCISGFNLNFFLLTRSPLLFFLLEPS